MEQAIETTLDIGSFIDLEISKGIPVKVFQEDNRFEIIKSICLEYYNFDWQVINSFSRKREHVTVRFMIIYFTKQYTNMALKKIGSNFVSEVSDEGKDHTSVMHAVKRVSGLIDVEPETRRDADILRARIEFKLAS